MILNKRNQNTYCTVPWYEQMIDSDGSIRLCCQATSPILNDDGSEANITTNTLEEVWNNKHMQQIRCDMIAGVPPKDANGGSMCENCYKNEKISGESNRNNELLIWSGGSDYPEELISNQAPEYYDLRLGNICNLKCIMCEGHYSSKFATETSKILPLIDNSFIEIKNYFENDAAIVSNKTRYSWPSDNTIFQSILDDISNSNCNKLYVNGGEPTIVQSLPLLFNRLIELDRAHDIEIWLNTNTTKVDLEFYELLSKFKRVRLMLSIDGIGDSFEYIRYPANWNTVNNNIHTIVDFINDTKKSWTFELQPTIQLLNLLDIEKMIDYWIYIENKIKCSKKLTINVLHNPSWYSITLANESIRKKINDRIQNKYKNQKSLDSPLNILDNTLKFNQDSDVSIDYATHMHEIYKKTRNIDYLDAWFYNTIDRLR